MILNKLIELANKLIKVDKDRAWEYTSLKSPKNPGVETRLFQLSTVDKSILVSIIEKTGGIELLMTLGKPSYTILKEFKEYPEDDVILNCILAGLDKPLDKLMEASEKAYSSFLNMYDSENIPSTRDFYLNDKPEVYWKTDLSREVEVENFIVDTEVALEVSEDLLVYDINIKVDTRDDGLQKVYSVSKKSDVSSIPESFNNLIGILSVEFPDLIDEYCNRFYIIDGE